MADRIDGARSAVPLDPYRIQVTYGAGRRQAGIVQGSGADWFGPLDPLLPVAPAEVRGRSWDFPAGYNVDIRPRAYEPITFGDLRGLAESYDLLRLVIETRKDQIARLCWSIVPRDAAATPAVRARAEEIQKFFRRPDGIRRWGDWLRLLLEDLFVIDAPALFVCRSRGGALLTAPPRAGGRYGLHPVDGATLKRVIDDWGGTPDWPAPAYQQVLHGVQAVEYTARDMLYRPRNARVHRAYGMSPVEQILMTVNVALRRQLFTLQYFTEGNIPECLIGVPESWSTDQIAAFQRNWDAMLEGNLAARRHAKFVPGGMGKTFIETKDPELKGVFDEWLARVTCYAFSVSPEPFISKVNRATAETAHDQALEEGLAPLQDFIKGWIDDLVESPDFFASPELEFRWQDDREVDPVRQEQVLSGYVKSAIYTINEARARLGLDPLADPAASTALVLTGQGYVPIGANAGGEGGDGRAGVQKYAPDQPRVPAGNPDGGQWTREGQYGSSISAPPGVGLTSRHVTQPGPRYASLDTPPGATRTDAADPSHLQNDPKGLQYAGVRVKQFDLTNDPVIDATTKKLTAILIGVINILEISRPGMTPQQYGTRVHLDFANVVRAKVLPGIGYDDVETTFSLDDPDAPYGSPGSIRTDVILRDENGEIIAIYDVKTGYTTMSKSRANELRAKTSSSPDMPVIEIRVEGPMLKILVIRSDMANAQSLKRKCLYDGLCLPSKRALWCSAD